MRIILLPPAELLMGCPAKKSSELSPAVRTVAPEVVDCPTDDTATVRPKTLSDVDTLKMLLIDVTQMLSKFAENAI